MKFNFAVRSLRYSDFSKYFALSNTDLKKHGAYTFIADESPCYPCRVSLEDARIGENVLAISFAHHLASSPYRSSGPIFIRENAKPTPVKSNTLPMMLRHRLLSVRGYDSASVMIEAETTNGEALETVIQSQFSNEAVNYIHIHNAGPGCFNCSVERVL